MRWDKQKIFFSIILIAVLTFTWWLSNIFTTDEIMFDGDKRHDPDYFIKNVIATQTNEKGRKTYILRAKLYEHYSDDGTAKIINPYIIKYRVDQKPIHISANIGWLSKNGKHLRLMGNVKQIQGNNRISTNKMDLSLE